MTGIVVGEAVGLAVIAFFAVSLLHSYSGLLRRVQELEAGSAVPAARSGAGGMVGGTEGPAPAREGPPAVDISGVSLTGEAITLAVRGVRHRTLLAFLSSGCSTCARFWADLPLPALPGGEHTRLVVVPQGPADESVAALASLAPTESVDVVMSSECWRDYQVPGSPYFVLVDGPSGLVRGEGTAGGWKQVFDLMGLAEGDSALARGQAGGARKPASDRRGKLRSTGSCAGPVSGRETPRCTREECRTADR